jgi:hypothetical protein
MPDLAGDLRRRVAMHEPCQPPLRGLVLGRVGLQRADLDLAALHHAEGAGAPLQREPQLPPPDPGDPMHPEVLRIPFWTTATSSQ